MRNGCLFDAVQLAIDLLGTVKMIVAFEHHSGWGVDGAKPFKKL